MKSEMAKGTPVENEEIESWDKRIQNAFAHYKETHEIQDILLTCYDQHGMWIPTIWHEVVEEALIAKLMEVTIPLERRENTNEAGERTLQCSFVDDSDGKVEIPYHHVKGGILVSEAAKLNAPLLRSVGERILSPNAIEFHIPNLQFVGWTIEAQSACKFIAPNLQSVGGSLWAFAAEEFHVPSLKFVEENLRADSAEGFCALNLQTVGGDLEAQSAIKFNAPVLQSVGGHLNARLAEVFSSPELHTVEGSMYAGNAKTLNADKLKLVKGDLDTKSAIKFYKPLIDVRGKHEMHPDAERVWKGIAFAISNQPEMEI